MCVLKRASCVLGVEIEWMLARLREGNEGVEAERQGRSEGNIWAWNVEIEWRLAGLRKRKAGEKEMKRWRRKGKEGVQKMYGRGMWMEIVWRLARLRDGKGEKKEMKPWSRKGREGEKMRCLGKDDDKKG